VIRVVVVDDHAVVRRGLIDVLSASGDIEVVADVDDGAAAVAAVGRHHPDVVLMDLSMPGMDGAEATRRLSAETPEVPVVILTSFSEQTRIVDAIDAGATGYLLKDADPDELLRGVRAAAAGEAPFSPKAAKALLTRASRPQPEAELTAREREVLACVAAGLPNKLIARRLAISEKTVKSHLTSVFQRIGVTDRTQAALWAHRHGLDDPPSDHAPNGSPP
jgi:DNA-binding NarL/FixJ family response regulator